MTVEPRAALDRLIAALEQHFAAASSGRGEDDPAFVSAYETMLDAFETYDEALFEATGIDMPFIVYDDAEEDEDSDDDDDDVDDDDMDESDLFGDDEDEPFDDDDIVFDEPD